MEDNVNIYAAMQTGVPFKVYKKTILGKVYVNILDPFSGDPVGFLISGNPKKGDDSIYFKTWTEKDDMYFRRMNRTHFERGVLVEAPLPKVAEVEKPYTAYSDEELTKIINRPFLALQAILNKIESDAVLFRMVSLAEGLEKSEGIMKALRARLEEVQTLKVKREDANHEYD